MRSKDRLIRERERVVASGRDSEVLEPRRKVVGRWLGGPDDRQMWCTVTSVPDVVDDVGQRSVVAVAQVPEQVESPGHRPETGAEDSSLDLIEA